MFDGISNGIIPYTLLATGFSIGLLHATEADHVAAVATLVSKSKRISKAAVLAALWGTGHTLALFMVGVAVLFLAINIPEELSLFFEFGVGIMLIILGSSMIINLRNGRLNRFFGILAKKHIHPHSHGDKWHIHAHSHDGEHAHSHKSLIIGIIHGLAGSGALMLLILPTIDSAILGLTYIMIFGIGSIVGMIGVSTLISLPFVFTAQKSKYINKYLAIAISILSIIIGIYIIYEIIVIS